MDYLKKRGIKKETIAEFQIGLFQDNSDYFSNYLKNLSEEEISQTGLFYKNEKYKNLLIDFIQE